MSMAEWNEVWAVLARLRDERPGPLMQWPDPSYQHSPPFRIKLAASSRSIAEDLHRRFGDDVLLTVGFLPFPPTE
jgi:hypothetical protein